jgi:hypothetical protein
MLDQLHGWRDAANGFNRRLDLTELRMFLTNKPDEVGKFDQMLHDNAERLQRQLAALQQFLPAHYTERTSRTTPSFSRPRHPDITTIL